MNVECSTCSTPFDSDLEGMVGEFGIIPVAFCATCRVCIHDLAEQEWDLVPREDDAHVHEFHDNPDMLGWRTCACGAGIPPSLTHET